MNKPGQFTPLTADEIAEMRRLYVRLNGNLSQVAKAVGRDRATVRKNVENIDLSVAAQAIEDYAPRARYILTSAQNNTKIHGGFWQNLVAYARYIDAEIIVGGFVYNKDGVGQRAQEKEGSTANESIFEHDARLAPHMVDKRRRLAADLVWTGELNVLPTAEDPLSGLLSYTRGDSAIVPHVKVALRSVATMGDVPAKMVYTTGAVTLPNYIARKAGQKAEFHHVIGAVVVEVDGPDVWFARQLIADKDGTFFDFDIRVKTGMISDGHRPEAVIWGDVHEAKLDDYMRDACWRDPNSIAKRYRPQRQVYHDMFDAEAANPHDAADPFKRFALHHSGRDDVRRELDSLVNFLDDAHVPDAVDIVVYSNHDDMLLRWLKRIDPKTDPRNAVLYHELALAQLNAILAKDREFNILQHYIEPRSKFGQVWLSEDRSLVVKGTELSLHGHKGPNGVKGSPQVFRNLGTKVSKGHDHTASIYDGVWSGGVMARLRHGYNSGPSSWSHTFQLLYSNGKRAMVTMRGAQHRGD